MSKISDLTSLAIRNLIGNGNYSKAALAINGASAATVKTTSAISYTVNGIYYTKTTLAAQSIAVTNGPVNGKGYNQPTGTTAYYALSLDSSGTVYSTQGTYAGQVLPNGVVGDGSCPDIPAGTTVFGIMKVANATGANFVPGTTALDTGSLTVTYYDVSDIPSGSF